jgi:hypothetical protein
MTEPEIVEETWIFGGSRVGKGGVKVHAWVPANHAGSPDSELWFKASGSYAVGAAYTVRVSRTGDRITKHGAPVFRSGGGALTGWTPEALAGLNAQHSAAETRLRLAAMERNVKRSSELDAALEPLLAMAGRMTAPDRAAFVAYVTTRLAGAWTRRG